MMREKKKPPPIFMGRIHGGMNSHGPIPWHVGIGYGSGKHFKYHCGGVIVDELTILSAANCWKPNIKDTLYVLAGKFLVDDPHAHFKVKEAILYENRTYASKSYKHDIVIFKLQEPLKFRKHLRKVCLPDKDFDFSKVKKCWISGWGKMKLGQGYENGLKPSDTSPKILQWTSIPLLNNSYCQMRHTETSMMHPIQITDHHLCAGYTSHKLNPDTCAGDDGGPLICSETNSPDNVVLVGIISEYKTCGRYLPGLYTNVVPYLDWIHKNLVSFILTKTRKSFKRFGKNLLPFSIL